MAINFKEYAKNWRIAHPTKQKIYWKTFIQKHPEYSKQKYKKYVNLHCTAKLKKRYGIDINIYNELFQKQDGKCAVCQKHQSNFNRRLAVDHNHQTGKIRGLLCTLCNSYIVYILENKAHLIVKGQEYLNKFKEADNG